MRHTSFTSFHNPHNKAFLYGHACFTSICETQAASDCAASALSLEAMTGEARPRQRKFAPRSRQGCLTCRQRRKRCDGEHPDCQNCMRLNLKCEWQGQSQIVAKTSNPTQFSLDLVHPPRASIDPWDRANSDDSTAKFLLRYYIEGLVPSISVATTPSSFYTSLYVPMASESEGVLDAIVALSAAQLARRSSDSTRAQQLRAVSSKHQAKCHSFIRDRISPSGVPTKDTYQVVGITLLLVGLEALNGNKSTKWLSQMNSVRTILNTLYLTENTMTPWELDSLRRHFTYYDVMASLMAGVSKSDQFPAGVTSPRLYTPTQGLTIDPLMGISDQLCSLICRIQHVTSPTPAFPQISKAAFDLIEREIQGWAYESPLTSPDIDLPIALDLIALAESYRLAALIQLYRTSDAHRALIPSCASRAMEFISRIPPGSPAESSLLYPMLLAGAELETESEISKCFKRLTAIQERNRYENVGNLREVLQEVWKPVLNGGERRDWEDILKEWEWSFSLG